MGEHALKRAAPPTRRQIRMAAYIRDMIEELASMARKNGDPILADQLRDALDAEHQRVN